MKKWAHSTKLGSDKLGENTLKIYLLKLAAQAQIVL